MIATSNNTTVRRDWLKRQIEKGNMEAKTVFEIEHDGNGSNDVYGGEWKPARIRHPRFEEFVNQWGTTLTRCADPDFRDGWMNFNESDFRSGSGSCYRTGTNYCLHVHSNAVYEFRTKAK